MEILTDRVWVSGDDVDMDIIIPMEYLTLKTIDDMKQYDSSSLRLELVTRVREEDITVTGRDLGCDFFRGQAPEIIRALGIECAIAKSFVGIFFRNSINNELLFVERPDLYDDMTEGGSITMTMNHHVDHKERQYTIASLPRNLVDIIDVGGLVKVIRKLNGLD